MFGRPRLLHDEDIDQELPDEANDEDLLEEDPTHRTGSTDSMMIASVLHYRWVPKYSYPKSMFTNILQTGSHIGGNISSTLQH